MTKNPLWTAAEIARATGGTTTGTWTASGFSYDSRTVNPGDVFVAIRSDDFPRLAHTKGGDGHNYIAAALAAGAAGVMAQTIPPELAQDPRVIKVSSTAEAWVDLGIAARNRFGGLVVGIAGAVGKTSTREMTRLVLNEFGQTHHSVGNYNNILGVPHTLAHCPVGHDYAVVEMGMDAPGEMRDLTRIVRPHAAIITTIALEHMENFPTGLDGIADAEAEIFDSMGPGGIAILNRDMDQYARVLGHARTAGLVKTVSFGEHQEADARLITCTEARNGTRVTAMIMGETVDYFIQGGKHLAMNALAVLLLAKVYELDLAKAATALARFAPVTGRGTQESLIIGDPNNPVILIDESYNASPAAMNAAFRVVALIDPGRGGRRIAILGDMLELGPTAPQLHADLALPIRAAGIDLVYTCGTLMKYLHEALPANTRGAHRDTSSELAKIVPDVLVPGDVVMVKGSKSSRMDVVVEALRQLPKQQISAHNPEQGNRHAL
jgi:UDP-N-acetylmuramoyl-tripeptide--D-alanyl-D-alanine ligase